MYLMNGTRFAGNEMLTIETYVAPSRIHGLGLFTTQAVEQGTIVCYYEPTFDVRIHDTRPHVEITKTFLEKFSFKLDGQQHLFSDDFRYINHKVKANLCYKWQVSLPDRQASYLNFIAIVDIPSGSELTIDYATIDEEHYKRVTNFVERRDAQLWPPKVKL